ncbi:hypothetical protein MTP04_14890 [Lysinibacillus sp. PLM2]|nr:hypothetical protein MTP04_14890 [Lysinibacillus sp. PLM2]
MQKKWVSYSLLVIVICTFSWTIYTGLFFPNNASETGVVIGSNDIKLDEEEVSAESEEHSYSSDEINESQNDEEQKVKGQEQIENEGHTPNVSNGIGHVWHGHSHIINNTEVMEVEEKAPEFVTKTLDGETVRLSDFLGKKVIINFWTTWCPPCQEEIPELQKFYENSASSHNVVLVGLNITDQDYGIDVIQQFRDYYSITYPILLDETGDISLSYDILTIPTTYIIDEKGNLEKQILGPLTEEMLNDVLKD